MSSTNDIDANACLQRQDALLVKSERFFDKGRIPKTIVEAFLKTPRHLFAPKFYSAKHHRWIDSTKDNFTDHLAELYDDHPLSIFRDENGSTLSTISQPSLVLYMLDLLELEPGMKVFELGGGSGWNAAMIGRIIGPKGHVTSVEIIDELARIAKRTISSLGLQQVETIFGDASSGIAKNAPYDRGIFTASSWSLPSCFFEQIKDHGILLLVLAIKPGIDLLTTLRKVEAGIFKSELHFTCSFVPVTGTRRHARNEPTNVCNLGLSRPQSFTWSDVKIEGHDIPAFISFVELINDCQNSYLVDNPDFGYADEFSGFSVDETAESLVLFNDDGIRNFGSDASLIELRRAAKRWLKSKKPGIEELRLSIHAKGQIPEPRADQWLVQRDETTLCWSV